MLVLRIPSVRSSRPVRTTRARRMRLVVVARSSVPRRSIRPWLRKPSSTLWITASSAARARRCAIRARPTTARLRRWALAPCVREGIGAIFRSPRQTHVPRQTLRNPTFRQTLASNAYLVSFEDRSTFGAFDGVVARQTIRQAAAELDAVAEILAVQAVFAGCFVPKAIAVIHERAA